MSLAHYLADLFRSVISLVSVIRIYEAVATSGLKKKRLPSFDSGSIYTNIAISRGQHATD